MAKRGLVGPPGPVQRSAMPLQVAAKGSEKQRLQREDVFGRTCESAPGETLGLRKRGPHRCQAQQVLVAAIGVGVASSAALTHH